MEDGSHTAADKLTWGPEGVRKILTNEKHMRDALLQRTYMVDVLTKKRVTNNGIVPQYYVENSHEAIIPKEIFMQVQEELIRRSTGHISSSRKKRNFSCIHPFPQIVFCEECGERYHRVHWNNCGNKSIVLRCVSRLENTGLACHSRTVLEDLLKDVVVKAINDLLWKKDDFFGGP